MEEDKVVQVEAVVGGPKGNVRLIHGKAPFELLDLALWIELIKEYLDTIVDLCEDTDREISVLVDLIEHATRHPMYLLDQATRALKLSFPDDPTLAKHHYEEEEEEQQKEEERQAQRAKDLDPVRLAESDRKALVLFMDNLRSADFDVTKIVKDLLAGKSEEPIERYKANGSGKPAKAPEVPLTGRTRRGDGKGGQAHASI
jgi:hypothetical protein